MAEASQHETSQQAAARRFSHFHGGAGDYFAAKDCVNRRHKLMVLSSPLRLYVLYLRQTLAW